MNPRWMHPPERARPHDREAFDPVVEGSRYCLDRELLLGLWARVCAEMGDDHRRDVQEARRRLHVIAARIAARGGRLRPDIGRTTRVDVELNGLTLDAWSLDESAPRVPGRQTLVGTEAQRGEPPDELAAARGGTGRSSLRTEPPGASEAMPATDARSEPQPRDRAMLLVRDVGARMSRLFAFDLTRVMVVPESPVVTGSTRAVTKDDQVHFRPGAYQPGTREGDRLIAHELAHVVQQRGGSGERSGTRKEIEREADRAARRVARPAGSDPAACGASGRVRVR